MRKAFTPKGFDNLAQGREWSERTLGGMLGRARQDQF